MPYLPYNNLHFRTICLSATYQRYTTSCVCHFGFDLIGVFINVFNHILTLVFYEADGARDPTQTCSWPYLHNHNFHDTRDQQLILSCSPCRHGSQIFHQYQFHACVWSSQTLHKQCFWIDPNLHPRSHLLYHLNRMLICEATSIFLLESPSIVDSQSMPYTVPPYSPKFGERWSLCGLAPSSISPSRTLITCSLGNKVR